MEDDIKESRDNEKAIAFCNRFLNDFTNQEL